MQVVGRGREGELGEARAPGGLPKGVAFWGGVALGLAFARSAGKFFQVKSGTSVAVKTLEIKPYDRVVLWVNGVDTDNDKFISTLNHLHDFLNGKSEEDSPSYKVAGFHRDTLGLLDRAQAGIQLLHSRMKRCSRISRAAAGELANYMDELVEKGASVVVVAHSAGNLLTREAYFQMKPENRDRVGFVGIGDPHGVHPSGLYVGIMNESDHVRKHNSEGADIIVCPTPVEESVERKAHHGSRTGYLVEDSIIGGAIKFVVSGMFEILKRYPQYDSNPG